MDDYAILNIEGRIAKLRQSLSRQRMGWNPRSGERIKQIEEEIAELERMLPEKRDRQSLEKLNYGGETIHEAVRKGKIERWSLGTAWETKKNFQD